MPTYDLRNDFFKNRLLDLPEIDAYKHNLQTLKGLTDGYLPKDEIGLLFSNYAGIIPLFRFFLAGEIFNDSILYRVRSNVDLLKEDITTSKPFTYAPVENCSKNMRASPKGHSVFYCSNSVVTSIVEMKLAPHSISYIGEWKTNLHRDLNFFPFMNPDAAISSVWANYAEQIVEQINRVIESVSVDRRAQLTALMDFTSKAFLGESEYYTLSSWLSGLAFNEMSCDLIAYPIFMALNLSANLAFRTCVADEFSLEKVYKFITKENHAGQNINIELLGVGEKIEEKIVWRNRQLEDCKLLQLIHKELNG